MGSCGLLVTGLAAALFQAAAPESVVLRNEHLTVTIQKTDVPGSLQAIESPQTTGTYRFENDRPFSLFVVPAEAIHDPKLPAEFSPPSEFAPDGVDLTGDRTRVVFRFQHPLVQVEVNYQLDAQAPVLRKTIVCKAKEKAAYVAGVRQWTLKPVDIPLAWPKSGTLGQPAVLLTEKGGCVLTLEWLRAEVTSDNGQVTVGFRPGYQLAPGQSQEVAAGSILCFQRTFEKDPLDAARHAFFDHMVARVKPKVPCPIKFTTWGPWLGQARADRCLEIMDDLAYVGTNIFHFDAGWQWPFYPYSERLPGLRDAEAEAWDRGMTQPERVPNGLLPIVRAANERGMSMSLWFDACGHVFVRETDKWAARDEKGEPAVGRTWEGRTKTGPVQSLASEYGDRLRAFVLEALDRYKLGGVMFDNNHPRPDYATDHNCLANGWDSVDVQYRRIMDIFDECGSHRPGIYRFFCNAASWPWALQHVTHIHAGDPGTAATMAKGMQTDCPARALAYERRLAWEKHYTWFVPPWGIKGDIAGWSLQQSSPIPVNLTHTDQIIPAGEGWTENMFTCFATTCIRDIRFAFRQMPAFDRDILKEWLAWDRRRTQFIFNCRPLGEMPKEPNSGIAGFSHVGQGRGVIYLFNCSFGQAEATLMPDENAGFRPSDTAVSAYIVYPMRARLAEGKLSYGQSLKVPIAGKDCVVIEVGLEAPDKPAAYAEYVKAVASVKRSFDALFQASADDIVAAVRRGPIRVEVGQTAQDRRLAAEVIETLGAAIGRRLSMDDLTRTPLNEAGSRLIIGTHDGLSGHSDVGKHFKETLYNRYLDWEGKLISAPLAAQLPGAKPPTFCLIAPRPEQLARLAIELVPKVTAKATAAGTDNPEPQWASHSMPVSVPAGQPILRFRPLMKLVGALVMPGDLDLVRYEIHAERNGQQTLLWREDIPPFCSFRESGGWWDDRVISIADLAGQEVTFHFTAAHVDGRKQGPMAQGGFDRIGLLSLAPAGE
jgi:hypothetical protein